MYPFRKTTESEAPRVTVFTSFYSEDNRSCLEIRLKKTQMKSYLKKKNKKNTDDKNRYAWSDNI